ncbi:MAG TPA: AMP-binding protein, partial [Thermoanaerobaculia bacterium]|nr:AMP-binding protein [Thermoanaerobaculia bacterium]
MRESLFSSDDTPTSMVDVLRARALQHPERTAFVFLADGAREERRLTYAELDAEVRAVAARLAELGLRGRRALLLYPAGLDFVVAFLGCLYAGVVAVPSYPPSRRRLDLRLQAIARNARPDAVLTTAEIFPRYETIAAQIVELGQAVWLATDEPTSAAEGWQPPVPGEIPDDALAFLQYTSGSTATPKGVMVSHGNLIHNEEMIRRAFRQSERSVIVGWLPLFHDMGLIGNVLQPLYAGASCVLMPPMAFLQRPSRWLEAVSRYRATTSGGPNFAYDLCVRRIAPAERERLDLSSWEVAFNGAEPVRAETLERFAEAFAPQGFRREAFYPCYGLAEATLFVTGSTAGCPPSVGAFEAAALERGQGIPGTDGRSGRRLVGCGRGWAGQEIVLVEPGSGRRLGPGEVGEIWIAGRSVAQGYWESPEETARTFGARLEGEPRPFLRTGDLGFLAEGELFVTGRLKDLIIVRGRNHYPQDIERAAEESHPALRPGNGAAFSVELAGEERLVVVQEIDRHRLKDAPAALEAVRRAVAEEHEVQVHEVVLVGPGGVPKTSSGKIQRQTCRSLYLAGELDALVRSAVEAEEGTSRSTPRDELEREGLLTAGPAERWRLLAAWLRAEAARVLGIPPDRLEPDLPLTTFGLDSLAAVELQARIEEARGASVSLAGLLDGGTVTDLATSLLDRIASPTAGALCPEGGTEGDFLLSFGQRALWFLHRLAPESRAYHLAGAARVRGGEIAPDALARAAAALVERHPALRTTFPEGPDGPVQRVHPPETPEVLVEDGSGWSEDELLRRLEDEAYRPFDLARGPLLRLALFRTDRGPVLLLSIHHIIADFWSLAVLARDLAALYAREAGLQAAVLPPLELRYTDWAQRQAERTLGAEGERLWVYWRDRLSGPLPALDLPTDRPRPPLQTYAGGSCRLRLESSLVDRLASAGAPCGATLYMALVAGFQTLLHRYTGQEDLPIGSPTASRGAAGTAGLVGYLVNPIVLRGDLAGDPSFTELLVRTRRMVLEAFEHQAFPFPLLAERLQPNRDPARSPLFDAMLAFEKARGATASELGAFAVGEEGGRLLFAGLEAESLPLAPQGAPFDLTLIVAELRGGGLGALLRFNTDLLDGTTAERMLRHWGALLAEAACTPEMRISTLPLVSEVEAHQALVEWNAGAAVARRSLVLQELFEAAAQRFPEATALIAGSGEISYGALDSRSNRLARHLRRLGVGLEVRVGVCLERSPEMVVSLLAVLKAGGAYLPLDPAYPAERLAFMLQDGAAA